MATRIMRSRFKWPLFLAACAAAGEIGMVIAYGALSVSNLAPSMNAYEIKQATIRFWHDKQRKVGCWITEDGGMSCMPDDRYTPVSSAVSDVPVLKTQPKNNKD